MLENHVVDLENGILLLEDSLHTNHFSEFCEELTHISSPQEYWLPSLSLGDRSALKLSCKAHNLIKALAMKGEWAIYFVISQTTCFSVQFALQMLSY